MRRNRPHARFEDLVVPGARYSLAVGFNDRRQVVGVAFNDLATGSDARGFLLTGDTVRHIEIRGTTRTIGFDINNPGQIVAMIAPPPPPPPPPPTSRQTPHRPPTPHPACR